MARPPAPLALGAPAHRGGARAQAPRPRLAAAVAAAAVATLGGCFEGPLQVDEPLPVADAGFDQIRFSDGAESVVVDLDARASCDPLGGIVSAATWEVVEAPPSSTPQVSSTGTLRGLFEARTPGVYLLTLVVTADTRTSRPDFVMIEIREGSGDDVVVGPPDTNACGDLILD